MIARQEILALAQTAELPALMARAASLRDAAYNGKITYSRKIFIPLTQLCRDVCHYCTFAHPPKRGQRAYMTHGEILAIARAGVEAGCKEALFTLGDKPELRYRVAREELASLGHDTTLGYLAEVAELVFRETGILPHLNAGVMSADDMAALRRVSVSQGLMLESISPRLAQKGMPHHGSPDKRPEARLATIRAAGKAATPFTTGILIGIGETRLERIESLLALRDLHQEYGHIQEIIIQNFRAKPLTRMENAPEPSIEELLWTIAMARLIFTPDVTIQAPPNLSPGMLDRLIDAGLNDWGGVSPVTPDHVNPEAPWPHLDMLAERTADCGKVLVERLAIYPDYALDGPKWLDPAFAAPVLRLLDADGLPRTDDWLTGAPVTPPDLLSGPSAPVGGAFSDILKRASDGADLSPGDVTRLFGARGGEFAAVCRAADDLRRAVNGDTVSYIVTRNINYTNVCYFKCQFCAFSKGKMSENLRGKPYDLDHGEITRRAREAWARGATEVCMQGGIHPEYTGQTYLDICRAVKVAVPDMHVHAFSPLEVWQGARTLKLDLADYLDLLRDAGLGSLPGTAAEILDDEVRATLCADKVNTHQWLDVMRTAHNAGIRTTSTIMYGHIERPVHWARHLLHLRDLQKETGGFTEFVPLPFVASEAPIYLKGRARRGPTFREAVLMHAVARLALHPHITNIQTSWVKMGPDGVKACLNAGANDLGGTLMNETITRAAGAEHGQEMPPEAMERMIRAIGRTPVQRTTFYGEPPAAQIKASFNASDLGEVVNNPARRYERETKPTLYRPGLNAAQ